MARSIPQTTRRASADGRISGGIANAQKFSINLSSDVGTQLRRLAFEERVSESSVIEIALRQLFRRISPDKLGAFLKDNGACLRRRS